MPQGFYPGLAALLRAAGGRRLANAKGVMRNGGTLITLTP
jgi:hypothetical protein